MLAFRDFDGLISQAKRLLEEDGLSAKLGDAAALRAHRDHTYPQRLTVLLENLASGHDWESLLSPRHPAASANPPGRAVKALLLAPSRGLGGGIERYVQAVQAAFTNQGVVHTRLDLARPGQRRTGRSSLRRLSRYLTRISRPG